MTTECRWCGKEIHDDAIECFRCQREYFEGYRKPITPRRDTENAVIRNQIKQPQVDWLKGWQDWLDKYLNRDGHD